MTVQISDVVRRQGELYLPHRILLRHILPLYADMQPFVVPCVLHSWSCCWDSFILDIELMDTAESGYRGPTIRNVLVTSALAEAPVVNGITPEPVPDAITDQAFCIMRRGDFVAYRLDKPMPFWRGLGVPSMRVSDRVNGVLWFDIPSRFEKEHGRQDLP